MGNGMVLSKTTIAIGMGIITKILVTANEACCKCKEIEARNLGRRELGGSRLTKDEKPSGVKNRKIGFLHQGGIVAGISRKIKKREGVMYMDIVESKDLRTSSKDSCKEWDWWNLDTPVDDELLCPQGQAVGTLWQSGLQRGTGVAEYSVEKGYCCVVPVTSDCEWKTLYAHRLGDMACDENSILTGFRMGKLAVDIEHMTEMKCCALE